MLKFKDTYRTDSNRLNYYDYSLCGAYFLTLCCKDRESLFGEINEDRMDLNDLGKIVQNCWLQIPDHFSQCMLGEFVIMPNHLHGIIVIRDQVNPSPKCKIDRVETKHFLSQLESIHRKKPNGTSQTIGSIIRGFKIGVTKYARNKTNVYSVWQPNYYDRIIRNEDELNRIRAYILQNPCNWNKDQNNIENIFM